MTDRTEPSAIPARGRPIQPRTEPRIEPRTALTLALALLLLVTLARLAQAAVLQVPLQYIDGAYQTLAMLRRLDAGELPGRDFFPYLGIGIPYLLWPIYRLAGGTLFAAQFAAAFAGLVACVAGGTLLGALLLRALGVRRVPLLALGVGGAMLIWALPGARNLHSIVMPGVSLYSLRSALAYLAALGCWWAVRDGRWRPGISGGLSAVALLWSNDFALTTTLMLHAVLVLHTGTVTGWRHAARACVTSLAIAAAGYALLGSLLTGGHLQDMLRYNFVAVAGDQHWYFGPYEHIDHYLTPRDVLMFWQRPEHELTTQLLLTLGFGATLVFARRLRANRAAMAIAATAGTALLAGMLSEFGGHKSIRYFQLSAHLLPLLPLVALLPLVDLDARARALLQRAGPMVRRIAEVGVVAATAVGCIGGVAVAGERRAALAADASLYFVPPLGGYVPIGVAAELAAARRQFGPGPAVALSTYLNPYDLILDHRQPVPVDSIIHALGWLRPQFVAALNDPRVTRVLTTSNRSPWGVDQLWENWNLHENWDFYRVLVRNFRPAFAGSRVTIWTRLPQPVRTRPAVPCEVRQHTFGADIGVPGSRAGEIFDLQVDYGLSCRGAFEGRRALVFVIAKSRNGHLGDRYTLPPHAQRARLPLIATVDDDDIKVRTIPFPNCRVRVTQCSAVPMQ